jgi:triacylglycerol esterase/lipase EstA (alpha/beta hydrolase family)
LRGIRRGLGLGLAATAALALAAVEGTPSLAATVAPAAPSAGLNDYSCRPSAVHPRPVVLVHGTFGNTSTWAVMAPGLERAGYCVFDLDYGCQNGQTVVCGTAPIEDSARQLAAFVAQVQAATGAAQVDIVGHSQGGMMPRSYMKFLGGAASVHQLIGLAPSNHGTTFNGLGQLAAHVPGASVLCAACVEQIVPSAFITNLNAGGDTLPGVRYTVIETVHDEVVTPYTSAFLSGPAVTNILLQSTCPADLTGHIAIPIDPNAVGWPLHALDPATAPAPACTPFGVPV